MVDDRCLLCLVVCLRDLLGFWQFIFDNLRRDIAVWKRVSPLDWLGSALGQTSGVLSQGGHVERKVIDDTAVHLPFVRLLLLYVFSGRGMLLVTLTLGAAAHFFGLCFILGRFDDKTVVINVDI